MLGDACDETSTSAYNPAQTYYDRLPTNWASCGEVDIMDTWATSSLSPQIVTGWERDKDLFERTFPMDLRPQAHDIIRTWLFATVVRAHHAPQPAERQHALARVGAQLGRLGDDGFLLLVTADALSTVPPPAVTAKVTA